MKRILIGSCCVLTVALIASGVWATKALQEPDIIERAAGTGRGPLSVKDMAQRSELIVTGQCTETKSEWIENGRILVTLATVEVSDVIKGAPSSTVTVILPGGIDANRKIPVAMTYAGAPTIMPQEEVFLFLTQDESVANGHAVVGFADGKLTIEKDQNGERESSRETYGRRAQNGAGPGRGGLTRSSLESFKEQVRGYLRQ